MKRFRKLADGVATQLRVQWALFLLLSFVVASFIVIASLHLPFVGMTDTRYYYPSRLQMEASLQQLAPQMQAVSSGEVEAWLQTRAQSLDWTIWLADREGKVRVHTAVSSPSLSICTICNPV